MLYVTKSKVLTTVVSKVPPVGERSDPSFLALLNKLLESMAGTSGVHTGAGIVFAVV